jgi:demethylmenaquinone methyltransferase/2-methoxy-6-polyprenyl-1,4-benzoquinol methylase
MFGRVAHRYDLLNHVLSFQTDRFWRARTVARLRPQLQRPGVKVMDLCCGTGDLMLALQEACAERVIGSDFCHPMLVEASRKIEGRRARSTVFEGDALNLPLAGASFDVITVAFGFRNFANYRRGLHELFRVLRPGGTLAILEFTTPPNPVFRSFYSFYSTRLLPRIGGWISGDSDAYSYLPESVRKFPDAPSLARDMEQAGFGPVNFEYMTFGIVALHIGRRPA